MRGAGARLLARAGATAAAAAGGAAAWGGGTVATTTTTAPLFSSAPPSLHLLRAWMGTWRKPGVSSAAGPGPSAQPGRARPRSTAKGRGGGSDGGGAALKPLEPAALVRLVMEDGTHKVVSGTAAAAAAAKARLDLVPVAPTASPPVYRLASAGAAAAEARAREAAARARAAAARRAAGVKEVRVTALSAPHDVATRLRRARELVEKGHTVKLAVPIGRGGVPRQAALARLHELGREAGAWADVRDPPAHAARGSGPASVSKYLWPVGAEGGGGGGGGGGAR